MMNWGIVSTADINRKLIPGAHASEKVDLLAVASRDQAGRTLRARSGRSAGVRVATRRCWPTRHRGRLHLAAEHAALRVVDQGPRGGQARALREAVDATPRRGRRRLRRRRPDRPAPDEAFMYRHNPQTKRLEELVAERSDRRAAARPLDVLATRSTTTTTSASRRTSRAARSWTSAVTTSPGRGCSPASRARLGRGVVRAVGHGLGLHRDDALPRRRHRARSTAARP